MKLLLTAAGIVLYLTGMAQVNPQPYLQKEPGVTITKPGQQKNNKTDANSATDSWQLANGNTVVLLAQDNMPCIIPKTEGNILNAGASLKNKNWGATIPNAGKKINPVTISFSQTHTDTLTVQQ